VNTESAWLILRLWFMPRACWCLNGPGPEKAGKKGSMTPSQWKGVKQFGGLMAVDEATFSVSREILVPSARMGGKPPY
jgi:hypothetical protein